MTLYLGDVPALRILNFFWTTNDATGAPASRTTSGEIRAYKDGSATQITANITDNADFDGIDGLNHCEIDLDHADFDAGSQYTVVVVGAEVDGVTVNAILAHFSIQLDEGVLALANGANGFAAIKTQTAAIEVDTQDIQSRLPAALSGGRMDSAANALANNVITAASTAADYVTEIRTGLALTTDLSALALEATAQAIKTKTDALPTDPADASVITSRFDSLDSAVAGVTFDDTAILTQIALVKAKTDGLPSDPADQSLIINATDAILARLGNPAGASMSADLAAILTSVGLRLLASSYTAPLDAAGTRAAVGLAAANLDTLLAAINALATAIKAKTDALPAAPAATGDIPSAATVAAASAAALLASVVEDTFTVLQSLRLINAASAGNVVDGGTSAVLKSLDGTKDRVTATVNDEGDRTVTARDVT